MSSRIETASLVLSAREVRFLVQITDLNSIRNRMRARGQDDAGYRLVHEICRAAYELPDAESGTIARQVPAPEERETWTVRQVASAARLADRTVRLHCEEHLLPAAKVGGSWIISSREAKTYIESRRRT